MEHGSFAYEYDGLYRLTSVDNPVLDDEAFTYDPVGNRLTSSDTTGTWSYNENNELNAYNDTSYEYDANGNMVQKTVASVVTNYIYNVEDRLTEVRDGSDSLIASYYYDPFGRRLWKDVDGVRTYFVYSDEGLIGEYEANGTEIKTYGYRPGSTWMTDPLFMKEGDNYYFYHNDHLGTHQKMTAMNGSVVWSAKYSSFGEAEVEDSSSVTNNLRFPGQYYDQETGLHYNYHRYYDPRTGRYLEPDPVNIATTQLPISIIHKDFHFFVPHFPFKNAYQFFAAFPVYLNSYSYVTGNSLNYIDPTGEFLFGLCEWVGTGPLRTRYGRWEFKYTIPSQEFISANIVLTMRVTCVYEKKEEYRQVGYWECCGIKTPSYKRHWEKTYTKRTSGSIYPGGPYHLNVIICEQP